MAEALEQDTRYETPQAFLPATELDEAAARRQLRQQVARLESELASVFCSAFPRKRAA